MLKKNEPAAYAVIGVGRFGSAVARTLANSGYQIIICDKEADKVRELRDLTPYAFVVEHITREALDEIGVRNCECAIVCIGSPIDVNILTCMHLINLGVPRVIAKATSKEQGQILEKIGAEVVYPEHDMGVRLAKRLMSAHLVDYFALNDDTEIYEVKAPENIIGKTVMEANLRGRYGINIIAVIHGSTTITDVDPEYKFVEGDSLVVIGKIVNIRKFEEQNTDI